MPIELKAYIVGGLIFILIHAVVVFILTCVDVMKKGKCESYLEYMMFHIMMGVLLSLIWPVVTLGYILLVILAAISYPFALLIPKIKGEK